MSNASPQTEIHDFLEVDGTDPNGKRVLEIYWTTRKYQIYKAALSEGRDGLIRYVLPEDYDTAKALRANLYKIATQRTEIETLRQHKAISCLDKDPDERILANGADRLLARCMAQAFEGKAEDTEPILEQVKSRLSAAVGSYNRRKYIKGNFLALAIFIVGFLLILVTLNAPGSESWTRFPFTIDVAVNYAKLGLLGSLGAFLSVSMGIQQINLDNELTPWEHVYAGVVRIVIGVIGALVIGLALDSKFLSPGFGSVPGPPVYYLLAFLAGFSETFVPNTLRQAEDSAGPREKSPPD